MSLSEGDTVRPHTPHPRCPPLRYGWKAVRDQRIVTVPRPGWPHSSCLGPTSVVPAEAALARRLLRGWLTGMETRAGQVLVHHVEHGTGRPVLVLHGAGVDHREAEACFEPALAG